MLSKAIDGLLKSSNTLVVLDNFLHWSMIDVTGNINSHSNAEIWHVDLEDVLSGERIGVKGVVELFEAVLAQPREAVDTVPVLDVPEGVCLNFSKTPQL